MIPASCPQHLKQIITEAQITLHEHHDLAPTQRQAIYAAFGPWGRARIDTYGYRRRARLALLSVYHVLPLVERLIPQSRSRELVILAEQVLAGKRDRLRLQMEFLRSGLKWSTQDPTALKVLLAGQRPMGYLSAQDAYATIEQVSFAALLALEVALFDEYNPSKVASCHWGDDTAGWCWVAFRDQAGLAKGSAAIQHGDAFWNWWLRQGVPLAWSSVQESSPAIQ